MDLQTVKNKVEEIAKNNSVNEQEIYSKIMAFLDTIYTYKIPTDLENKILEDVKLKIFKVLYSKERHRQIVNQATKYNTLFGLDEIEMKYLGRAFQELETDDQVSSLMYEISLTEKGIMTARNLK